MNTHDPLEHLAYLSIRETFGTTVQLVSDVLQSRGEMTLSQLVTYLKRLHSDDDSAQEQRRRLGVVVQGTKRPSPSDRSSVRAALVVLLQHDIVSIRSQKHAQTRQSTQYYYVFQPQQARRLLRYAKYIEFLKKVVLVGDDVAASVLQCLLIAGRLRTVDWILQAVNKQQSVDPRYTAREQVIEAAYKLESLGFVIPASPLDDSLGNDQREDEEYDFEGKDQPPTKRPRFDTAAIDDNSNFIGEDPAILAILNGSAHYKKALPVNQVWKVNLSLFHAYQRAYQLGRLVAERYGHKVQSCGSLVTAALKFQAQCQFNPNEQSGGGTTTLHNDFVYITTSFAPSDIVKHIPKPVLQIMEKKPGGLHCSLAKAFDDLVQMAENPVVIRPSAASLTIQDSIQSNNPSGSDSTDAGSGIRYEVQVLALTRYLQERVVHQIIGDRHGIVAARVVSILWKLGYLESETLAEHAMVPVKEVREVLHCLYKSNYVDLIQLSTSARQQHQYSSYSNTIYLWGIHKSRLKNQVTENVARALTNIRLRRQHELEIGKQWIQRAQQSADTDENDHEKDRLNYTKFCLGLERLDVAALQLDDTFLVLNDFR